MKVANPIARLGEDLACKYLQNNGYKIIERNFHGRYGEIDIIAIDQSSKNEKVLAFVEVKTRTSLYFGTPFESITVWKLKSIQKTALYYQLTHPSLPKLLRIDAVSVLIGKGESDAQIELLKNISS